MDSECTGLFEDWEMAIAVSLVDKFQREWDCLEREDTDGLVWECLTHWYYNRERYNPRRGASPSTFMARVIRNKLIDLVRSRCADKRRVSLVADSLDQDPEETKRPRTPSERVNEALAGEWARRGSLSGDLALDLERAIEDLSVRQRDICRRIREGYSVSELSELLETPRANIYDEIGRIRRAFAKRGLKDYLR